MPSVFDLAGILLYAAIAFFFYKRGWFFSFYSFFKFLIVILASIFLGVFLAGRNTINLPITNLQLSLIIQGLVFIFLWKVISFKKLFFAATGGKVGVNRFIFIHHIDRFLNIIPAITASFFVTFFLFTVLVSLSTHYPALQNQIEASKIVKPLSYKIYFTALNSRNFGLFENVAYKITPAFNGRVTITDLSNVSRSAIDSFAQKLVAQKMGIPQQPGVSPLVQGGGSQTFIPPVPIQSGPTQAPQLIPTSWPVQNGQSPQIPPTAAPPQPIPTATPTNVPPPSFIPPIIAKVLFPTEPPIPTPTLVPAQPTSSQVEQQMPTQVPPPPIQTTPAPPPIQVLPPANTNQAEQDIFRLTNEQRVQNGVPALAWSEPLAQVARAHSQDMATRNFFAHVNPDGLDPFQRMKIGGISYLAAGENIAGGPTADIMMTNWMQSPPHRENILNPSFGHMGVGVAIDPQYGLVATQDFTN